MCLKKVISLSLSLSNCQKCLNIFHKSKNGKNEINDYSLHSYNVFEFFKSIVQNTLLLPSFTSFKIMKHYLN